MFDLHADLDHKMPLQRGDACLRGTSACETCGVRELSLCGTTGGGAAAALSTASKHFAIGAKHTLFEEGDRATAVYTVVSGSLLFSKILQDGRRQIIGIALPGDFIGLTLPESHAFTATALDQVELCRIDKRAFADLLDRSPDLMRRLHAMSARELARAQDHMMLLGRLHSEEKVASFLICLQARWARVKGASPRLDLPMSRQEIGDYLGVTLETVSRTFSKLVKRKLIAIIPDGIRIMDAKGLADAAGL